MTACIRPGIDVTAADVARCLDDSERQTGSRYCTDQVILAEVAGILRQAVESRTAGRETTAGAGR